MTFVTGAPLDASLLQILNKATPLSENPGNEVLGGSKGLDFRLFGTFSAFDSQGHAQAGVLDTFQTIKADRVVMNWSNIGASSADFWAAVKTGNVDAVGNVVFAGADKFDIVGSINGAPPNVYSGYGGDDVFHLNLSLHGAAAVLNGGDGNDTFNLDNNFDAATDRIDGGTGFDTVNLTGGSAADLTFGANSMVGVERIVLASGVNYAITTHDNTVAAGATLQVDASALAGRWSLSFNGQAESNGAFLVLGGAVNDTIAGGRGADTIVGGGGADLMTGGQGADHFTFTGAFGQDTITDFVATGQAHDVIQFDPADFADFAAVQQHMAQVGADTVITPDDADSLVLKNVALGSLTAADFLFA
jgi:serralysin